MDRSLVFGLENLENASQLLKRGENTILLANHQTEPDPQAISILLEKSHPGNRRKNHLCSRRTGHYRSFSDSL